MHEVITEYGTSITVDGPCKISRPRHRAIPKKEHNPDMKEAHALTKKWTTKRAFHKHKIEYLGFGSSTLPGRESYETGYGI